MNKGQTTYKISGLIIFLPQRIEEDTIYRKEEN